MQQQHSHRINSVVFLTLMEFEDCVYMMIIDAFINDVQIKLLVFDRFRCSTCYCLRLNATVKGQCAQKRLSQYLL